MKRKTRIALIFLSFTLLFAAGDAIADSSGIIHLAVNDKLYDLSVRPAFVGSPIMIYLPSIAFIDVGVSVNYNYENGIASVSNGFSRIDFDLSGSGQAYDALGSTIEGVSAQVIGGQIYLPLNFLCELFGIGYSIIPGVGYGDVIRLNTGSLIDDRTFLSSYRSTMREHYLEDTGQSQTSPSVPPDRSDTKVYIFFTHLPTDEILNLLSLYNVKSCFFLSADDVAENPEMVRRLISKGHTAGVLLYGDEDFYQTAELIFEASRYLTFLAVSSESAAERAEFPPPVVFWEADTDASNIANIFTLTSEIDAARSQTIVRFAADSDRTAVLLGGTLGFLTDRKFDLRPVREDR